MNQQQNSSESGRGAPGEDRPAQDQVDLAAIQNLVNEGLSSVGKLSQDSKKLVKSEWSLTKTSMVLTALCLMCFSGMVLISWLFVCLTLGFYAFKLGLQPIVILLGMSVIQIVLCVALWKAGNYFAKHIGFKQTFTLLSVFLSK